MNTNELIAYHKDIIDYETVEALKKLEQIEQIFNEWAECGDYADSWAFRKIRDVLEEKSNDK